MKNNVTTSYKYLQLDSLSTEVYQRTVMDTLHIKRIINNYDPNQIGTIIVSYRDGRYNVIDGQHRVLALKTLGQHGVMANVFEGLTLEEEAKYFNAFNSANGESKKVKAHDVFRARVVAKEQIALDIKEAVEKSGVKMGYSNQHNAIAAYGTVTKICEKDGKAHLQKTITIIKKIWGGESISFHNFMIIGISEFIKTYGQTPNYSDSTLIKQLSKVDPNAMVREMKSDTTTNVTKVKAMNTIFKYYNAGLRKRLENNLHFSMR